MKNQAHRSLEIENPSKTTPSSISQGVHSASLLAQVSVLAWNLVIPIVGGVLLGSYLDNRFDNGVTWTLSLLVLGVLIAFSNLYNLYLEHGQNHSQQKLSKDGHKVTHDQEE